MDLGSAELWRWIWLAMAAGAAVGEIAVAGSFFLFPFAVGGGAAALAAFTGFGLVVQWVAFVAVSTAALLVLRPLARRLDARTPNTYIGAGRWVGRQAVVLSDIGATPGAIGAIRLDREEWRAESLTGEPIRAGSTVLVSKVEGTRCLVVCIEEPPELPEPGPLSGGTP